MAFEPYLMNKKQGCYRAPLFEADGCEPYKLPKHDPNCTTDKYTDYRRGRWNSLRQDICNRCPKKPLCPIKPKCARKNYNLYGPVYKPSRTSISTCTDICIPGDYRYKRGWTTNNETHAYPYSHNNVDDCCKPDCPCDQPLWDDSEPPECPVPEPCAPLDCCTTYNHFFDRKPVPCPPTRHMPDPYDPCECPLESATSYRVDYHPKETDPQEEAFASMIRGGLWSWEQYNKEFCPCTVSNLEYTPKCAPRRCPIIKCGNLGSGSGVLDYTSETIGSYGPKCNEDRVPYPDWIHNDTWCPPETPLEKCTTYKHFYKEHPIRPYPGYEVPLRTPDAIPFGSMNNMWYTCCDPKVDQRGPVELKDNDPWPYVVREPIKYQDNMQADPCAPFRDETTYKADYWAKKRCVASKWYGPLRGYTPPILPLNDNTTSRASYVAYPPDMMKEARVLPGNPCGIKWGPYECPPEEDKCRPRLPAPYGHPLKPYTCQCPCGQFDDRSMYHHDFKFWTPEMVDLVNDDHCRPICVPKGLSLYRRDFADGAGKKADIMPPPESKGARCLRPCSYHDLDTDYQMKYKDFWKELPYERVDKYRGKPTIKTRRAKISLECKEPECFTMFQMPKGSTVEDTLKFLKKEEQQKKMMMKFQ